MNITLERTEKELIRVSVDGTPSHVFDPVPVAPKGRKRGIAFLREPEREGRRLFAALFPPNSVARRALAELDARHEPDLITLVISHPDVGRIPWEYLCDEQGRFLVTRHRFTRGLPPEQRRDPPQDVPATLLQILAVPADPLCHRDGTPEMPVDVVGAVEDLAEAVRASGGPFYLRAVVPPTLDYLRLEMSERPLTILHFPGRGRTSPDAQSTDRQHLAGIMSAVSTDARCAIGMALSADAPPVLLFEDQAGMVDPVTAERLLVGRDERIFLVFLGADASVGDLAHRLVSGGVCYALEMRQTSVDVDPDARTDAADVDRGRSRRRPRTVGQTVGGRRSDAMSAASLVAARFLRSFYRCLATGCSVEEATRQARVGLASTPGAMGVFVLHTAHAGEGGSVLIDDEGKAHIQLWPPPPDLVGLPALANFRGYRSHLALLGTHWWDGASVVTILGEDGIGKTSLALQAAHRFRWRFPQGVLGLSLDPPPRPSVFLNRLAEWVWGRDYDRRWDQDRLLDELADRLREQERLLVLDGYEVLRPVRPAQSTENDAIVKTVRRLVCRLLGGKTRVLLTGREVVGISGEQTVHLDGLSPRAGAALFRALTPGRRWRRDPETGVYAEEEDLQDLSRAVAGYPLALEFLAGAYAAGQESLAQLKRRLGDCLRTHERTHDQPGGTHFRKCVPPAIAACLSIAMDRLPPELRALLPRLTLFRAPFLGGIAAAVFDDEDVPHHLQALAQARLIQPLEVEGMDQEIALYRFHPVVRRLVEPEVNLDELEAPRLRFVAAYALFAAAALQRFTTPVSCLIGLLLPDLDRALDWAEEEDWSELAFNLAGLWRQYGREDEALQLYRDVLAAADARGDHNRSGATLAMIGQMLSQRGEHRDALHILLTALSTLTRLQAMSDAARVVQIIGTLRQQVGAARFQTLWAEVMGDQPLPVWLTGAQT